MTTNTSCELCTTPGGEQLWANALCRVVLVHEPFYPGFCRVILNRHVPEMSDLPEDEQRTLMAVVLAVESTLRQLISPHKINLASLGNVTPHVHWHIIPRWQDDRCFPNPIWGEALRENARPDVRIDASVLREMLTKRLGTGLFLGENPS